MAEGWIVCPFCAKPRSGPDETICSGCGRSLAEGASPPAPAAPAPVPEPAVVATPPAAPAAPTIPAAPSVPEPRRPVLSSWRELRSILRVATYALIVWVAMSVIVGVTFGKAIENKVGADLFAGHSLAHADITLIVAQIAMFSSLVAGLGFQVFAGGGTITFSVVPFGSVAVIALAAAIAARRALRRNPPSSIPDLFIRVTLAAAVAAVSVYALSSLAILIYAQTIAPPVEWLTGGSGRMTAGSAMPSPEGLYWVLFPALWIGTAAGVFSLAPARTYVGRALASRRTPANAPILRQLGLIGIALRFYLTGLLLVAPVVVAGWVVYVLVNTPKTDPIGVALSLPAILAMAPNAVLALALAVTGSLTHLGDHDGALWKADPWLIAAGVAALVVPPLVAGFFLGRRRPEAGPGEVGLTALCVGVFSLLLTNIAAPSLKVAGFASSVPSGGIEKLTFDFGQAVLVGGAVTIVVVVAAFLLGAATKPSAATAQHPAIPMVRVS